MPVRLGLHAAASSESVGGPAFCIACLVPPRQSQAELSSMPGHSGFGLQERVSWVLAEDLRHRQRCELGQVLVSVGSIVHLQVSVQRCQPCFFLDSMLSRTSLNQAEQCPTVDLGSKFAYNNNLTNFNVIQYCTYLSRESKMVHSGI